MAKTRLVGSDGYVCFGDIGTEYVGDATEDLDDLNGGGVGSGEGFYEVTAIAATSSVFDWTSPKVGDFFWNDGTLVMATGDKARQLPYTKQTSIKGFELSPSKAKIAVTTLVDKNQTYRMGKADISGSMSGIFTVGSDVYNLVKRFMDRMDVSSAGAFTVTRLDGAPIYFVGFLQGDDSSGETVLAVVGQVELESFRLGATDGQAQEFTTNLAPAAGSNMMLISIATS